MSDTPVSSEITLRGSTTPEARPTVVEIVLEEPEGLAENGSSPESAQGAVANLPAAPLAAETAIVAFNPNSIFTFYVGTQNHQFPVDINDLRRESIVFRQAPIITSIELKHEDPYAFSIIHKWFSGNIGPPPYTETDRNTFKAAIEIARQLQIKECEAQLDVIVERTNSIIDHCLLDELTGEPQMTGQQIADRVDREMASYMKRSTNVGGRDDELSDEEEE